MLLIACCAAPRSVSSWMCEMREEGRLIGATGRSDSGVPFRRQWRYGERVERAAVGSGASQARVATMYPAESRKRTGNAVPVLLLRIWLASVVFMWCPVFCQESLTNRMRAISEDLDRQLNEIMASQALSYSTVNTAGLPYNATTKFNPKGMGQLYNVTNMFIDLVQSKQAYPAGE